MGLVIGVVVLAASAHDNAAGTVLLDQAAERWVVEQANGTLMLCRHLARKGDHRPGNSASRVYGAAAANMTRRLTTPTPAWRDTLQAVA
jgi:hypothetical protein